MHTALSLQQNVPFGKPEPEVISRSITRSLPAEIVKRWKVLPYKVAAGHLFVAGSELPSDEMHNALRKFSSLEIRFTWSLPRNSRSSRTSICRNNTPTAVHSYFFEST